MKRLVQGIQAVTVELLGVLLVVWMLFGFTALGLHSASGRPPTLGSDVTQQLTAWKDRIATRLFRNVSVESNRRGSVNAHVRRAPAIPGIHWSAVAGGLCRARREVGLGVQVPDSVGFEPAGLGERDAFESYMLHGPVKLAVKLDERLQRRHHDFRLPQVFPRAREILESGAQHIIIATGATWRSDGVGRTLWKPIQGYDSENVLTPDDVMENLESGGLPPTMRERAPGVQSVAIYDDDHYYMGGVLAGKFKTRILTESYLKIYLFGNTPLISMRLAGVISRLHHDAISNAITAYVILTA